MLERSPNVVSIQRCPDYDPARVRSAVRRLLEPWGGMKAFVRPGMRVLLKPNLIVPRPKEAAVTTHPEVVRAVALEAIDAGARPVVGDSPAFSSALGVASTCGILGVARELGIEMVDLGHKRRRRAMPPDSPFRRIAFGADALEADAIINLPKVKTHVQMEMSLSVKNMFGCVAGKQKAFFHFRNGEDKVRFGRMLVAVARFLQPALSIADAIVALERDGPTGGDPREVGLLLASPDPVALDRVALEVFGVDPSTVPVMRAAREMGYGVQDLDAIRIAGEALDSVRLSDYVQIPEPNAINFTLPRVIRSVWKQIVLLLRARRAARD
ncbi:DUF362 domain-containing protein [Candidatus Sumerlaeota bacterium]|nr:DUF362 domain-containing protein [Candidatus Sumerlaeota bacterium]